MQKTKTNKFVDDNIFFKPSSLAERLGVSEVTIRKWIKEGSKGIKLDASEIGTGSKQNFLISGISVNRFLLQKEFKYDINL